MKTSPWHVKWGGEFAASFPVCLGRCYSLKLCGLCSVGRSKAGLEKAGLMGLGAVLKYCPKVECLVSAAGS